MTVNSSNNRYVGDEKYISFAGVEVQSDTRNLSESDSYDTADTTAGSERDKSHALTLRAVSFELEFVEKVGSAGSATRAALRNGRQGTLTYGPEGTAAGKPKYSCLASVISVQRDLPYDDTVVRSVTLERNGAWLYHYEDSGSVFP